MDSKYIKVKIVPLALGIFIMYKTSGNESNPVETVIFLMLLVLIVFFYIRDIDKLLSISYIDSLTRIYNRHKFLELADRELKRHMRYDTSLSFIMLDIDNFKKVNDEYGHAVGDKTLKEVADLVSKNIRGNDIFARWGGEEFILMLPVSNSTSASTIAERLRALIENHPFELIGNLTVSIGVSELTECHSLIGTITQVDKALYESKLGGRNRVTISPTTVCGECELCTYT